MSSRRSRSLAALAAAALVGSGLGLVGPATSASAAPAAPAAAPDAKRWAKHSLRAAHTDRTFYFVMGDRFANGDPSNDEGGYTGDANVTGFDPTARGYYNGGDLAGLESQLDYIQGMGIDSIWLTPIFKNKPVQLEDGPSAGYHGYWITDFTQVDPHLGTNAELASLVDAAHAKGMKVFFDIITNHTADVIGYEEGARTGYVSKDAVPYKTAGGKVFDDRDYAGTDKFPKLSAETSFPYHPVLDPGEQTLKKPNWLNDLTLYHNRGDTTFVGENSQYGDFFGLDDLFTEHPKVVAGMTKIYQTWVGDFGIDGFRIDTMKHVDDDFWKAFGPGLVTYAKAHGKKDFFMFGEVALDGSGVEQKAFTSHYSTHAKMQSVLDFPFQDMARTYVSKRGSAKDVARFFSNDDWYTDRNSNAYQLPTFLGNHDMGRFGLFLKTDNPSASDDELLQRDRLAHELMFLSRGNPIVYYGDEQGFTGTGGDQLARQSMFASQVPDYQDDDQLGTDNTGADDNFVTTHPLYQRIKRLTELTGKHPALRNGAEQVRYAAQGPGIFAASRTDARQQREYVVAFNNAATDQTAEVPTYVKRATFVRKYGAGEKRLTTDGKRRLELTVPAHSAVVYALKGKIPESRKAPKVRLTKVRQHEAAWGRMQVSAKVKTKSFAEVTFQAKIGGGTWRSIGTDDNAPYRVFQDVVDLDPGTRIVYRAAVLDNAGHQRVSKRKVREVEPPRLTITTPEPGELERTDPILVTATPDPEHPDMTVTFQRKVGSGAWQDLGSDSSSPVYQVVDDVSDLDLGVQVTYRARMKRPGENTVRSAPLTVTVGEPEPDYGSITLAGSLQSEIGCPGDWDPACATSHLTFDTSDGRWHGTFTLPEGSYEWKVVVDDSWDNGSFGAGGGSGNIVLDVPSGGGDYEFVFDEVTKIPSASPAG